VQRRMPRSAIAGLKTAVEARLPGLLIAVISWCYKPNSHTHQAPGTGSYTQQYEVIHLVGGQLWIVLLHTRSHLITRAVLIPKLAARQ
jgi:hypothetical protein